MTLTEKVEYIVKEYGVKKNFIARKIGVRQPDISMFLCGDKDMKACHKEKLNEVFKLYNGLPFEV
jgi:hypothetical protein